VSNISTLVSDIYALIQEKPNAEAPQVWFTDELARDLSTDISVRLRQHYGTPQRAGLRLSQMGPRCPRSLWFSVHHPELAEALPAWATLKYAYGHILEAQSIALAKAAGHEVTGEQDEVYVDGVRGHRDAVIDGCVVDVKSCNSFSFKAIKNAQMEEDDFLSGYLDQLDGYVVGSSEDPLVRMKNKGYILAVDKTLGHMCLHEHTIRERSIRDRIQQAKRICDSPTPPACTCQTVPDGKSGNTRLDTKASYNVFKYECFPKLRTFLYSEGPRYLSRVERKPDVPEIDRDGNIVYN
jgi:hypothetical protein